MRRTSQKKPEAPVVSEVVEHPVEQAVEAVAEGKSVDGFPSSPWIDKGMKWYPLNVSELPSSGHIDYGCQRFAFRELSYGDMRMLARLGDTDNEHKVIYDVLNGMLTGVDVDELDPSDARFILLYIRTISLTDPAFYLRFTCGHDGCGAVNPFAFGPSDISVTRLDKDFDQSKEFEVNGVKYTLSIYGAVREIEMEDLVNEIMDELRDENDMVSEEDIIMSVGDAKMSAYLVKVDDTDLSVSEAYEVLKSLPYSSMREIGMFVAQIPRFGFNEDMPRPCHQCGKITNVKVPLSKLFFFSKHNDQGTPND